jgi:hypothetical protein
MRIEYFPLRTADLPRVRVQFYYLPLVLLGAAALCAQQSGTEIKMQWVVQWPGGKTGTMREEFSKQAKPGPGKELRVLVKANRQCIVSFSGFTHDGDLLYGPPEIVRLSKSVAWKELPASKKWSFEGNEKLEEMDAVIADPSSPDYKQYATLVAKMKPGLPVEVAQAQAAAMRDWIDRQLRSKTAAIDYTVKDAPGQIGALIRDADSRVGASIIVPAQKTSVVRIRIQ